MKRQRSISTVMVMAAAGLCGGVSATAQTLVAQAQTEDAPSRHVRVHADADRDLAAGAIVVSGWRFSFMR